jgi:nucleotide sugar dehydrogenase
MTLNIIGLGYVGNSLGYLCEKNNIQYNVYDINKKEGEFNYYSNISDLVENSEKENIINWYFICVPTPNFENGRCNVEIIEKVIKELNKKITKESYIIIKSTVEPGTCDNLYSTIINDNITLILNPEFLREDSYKDDVYNAEFLLIGFKNLDLIGLQKIYKMFRETLYKHNTQIDLITKTFKECEIFKYTLNTYLGLKIIYFNEIFELCEKLDVKYNNVKNLLKLDERIGTYGIIVPAHDGYLGHGKSCLQKDLTGMKYLREKLGLNSNILEEVKKRNIELRKIKID